jgi:hypothetical protein
MRAYSSSSWHSLTCPRHTDARHLLKVALLLATTCSHNMYSLFMHFKSQIHLIIGFVLLDVHFTPVCCHTITLC